MEENTSITQSVEAAPVAESSAPVEAAVAPIEAPQTAVQVEVSHGFLDNLSEDLRQAKSLSNFKDVNDLAKSYLNAQALIGKRLQDMSAEDLAHINHLKGIPDNADGYALPAELDPSAVDWYRKAAIDAGLSVDQAKKLSESFILSNREAMQRQQEEMQLQTTNWINDLKKEYGNEFENRVGIAKRAVEAFGGDELKGLLNQTGLGNHPTVVRMFEKIGKNLLEDQMIQSDYVKQVGYTPQEAKDLVNQKLSVPEYRDAYFNAMHPNHKNVVKEVRELLDIN